MLAAPEADTELRQVASATTMLEKPLTTGSSDNAERALRISHSSFLKREKASESRFLDRGQIMGQSYGRFNVRHNWGQSQGCWSADRLVGIFQNARRTFYLVDPFHSIVDPSYVDA